MKPNITLKNGRVVAHRPYLSSGQPNGATEAYMLDGGHMDDAEWQEYVRMTMPTAKRKPTWSKVKSLKTA